VNLSRAALLIAILAQPVAAEPAGWAPSLTTTVTWDSNATNANRDSDVIGALRLRGELEAFSRRISLGHDDTLLFSAGVSAEAWPRFDGLDRAAFGPRLAWRHKFGLGALAPVFSIELTADGVAARESDRSGYAASARLAWRQRFDEGTQLAVSYEQARQDARAAVFDRTGGEAAVEVTRELNEAWQVSLAARWREGDVLSYATPPRPDLVALARVRTTVNTFGTPRVAYSLTARSLGGSVAFTRTLGEHTALTLGYDGRSTERGPLRYVNHLVSAGLARQF